MRVAVIAMAMLTLSVPARAETTRLCAAGSLKAAMADITSAFEARVSALHKGDTVTGASGLLRERIEKDEPAHVFASADTGHPKRLSEIARRIADVSHASLAPFPYTALDLVLMGRRPPRPR